MAKERERLEQRLRKEEQELEQDRVDLNGRRTEELASGAESVISILMGRRRSSAASSALRKRRLTAQAKVDLRESEAEIERLKQEIEALKARQEDALADLAKGWAGVADQITTQPLRPRKTDIRVSSYGLAWRPYWAITYEDERGVLRDALVGAFGEEDASA